MSDIPIYVQETLKSDLSLEDKFLCIIKYHWDNEEWKKAKMVRTVFKPKGYATLPYIITVIEALGLPYLWLLLSTRWNDHNQRS